MSGSIQGRMLARNTVLNLAGQAIPLIVGVVTIPVIVRRLGTERFGVLSLTWALFAYFNVFDLGLGRAVTKLVAEVRGRDGENRIPSIIWTAVVAQLALGVVGGLMLFLFTPFLVERLLDIPPRFIGESRAGFYLLAGCVPVILMSASFRGALEAAQRFDLINAVKLPLFSAVFVCPLIGALLHWGLQGIMALLVAALALALLAYLRLCLLTYPVLRRRPGGSRSELRSLVRFGGWVTVSNLIGPVLVYMDRFLIGAMIAIGTVSYYSAASELVTRLWIIPASLMSTLFPAFSSLSGREDHQRIEKLLSRSAKWILVSLGPLLVLVGGLADDILRVWLGRTFAERSTTVLQILAVGVLFNSLAQLPYVALQARGRPDVTAKIHLAELPVFLFLAWLFILLWGIDGAALAWVVRAALDAFLLYAALYRLFPLPLSVFGGRVLEATLTVLLYGVATVVVRTLNIGPLPRISVLAVGFVCVLVLLWQRVLDSEDRTLITGLLGPAPPPTGSTR